MAGNNPEGGMNIPLQQVMKVLVLVRSGWHARGHSPRYAWTGRRLSEYWYSVGQLYEHAISVFTSITHMREALVVHLLRAGLRSSSQLRTR